MASPIGCPPEHLAHLCERVEGLRVTLDTSHAQLYLNLAGDGSPPDELRLLASRLAAASAARTIADFIRPLHGLIATAHVSDAEGLLGEGLPYGAGTMELDRTVDLLLTEARWIVAEIIEPDPDRSPNMRAAAERIAGRRALVPA